MESNRRNREWVKTAAIIFLSVLLVLTFFSNTILNRSLTEVATAMVTDGTITAKVRGSGTVTSNGEYEVKASETRKIQAVMVKKGSQVETGDVLFVLGEGDSQELQDAVEKLYQLQLSYRRASVGGSGGDYTLQEREISKAKTAVTEAEQALSNADTKLNEAKKNLDAAAEAEGAQADSSEMKAAEKKLENAQATLNALTSDREAKLETAYQENADALEAYSKLLQSPPAEDASDEDKAAYEAELATAKQKAEDTAKAYEELKAYEDPAITAAQNSCDTAQAELDRLMSNTSEAYANAVAAYNSAAEEQKTAKKDLEAAEDNVATLEYNLAQQKRSDGQSAALTAIELQDLNRQIEAQKAVVESLKGESGDTITAGSSGIVTDIQITAGQTAQKDAVLCTIIVQDMGYQLSFSVTNDQAKRLRTGDTATVSNYYWGTSITATLVEISTDPKNPRSNKLLTFDVEGSVNVGTELTLAVGSKSANYDITIPKSAIRTDSNGSFVLAIEARNNALGNRYFAKRVAVEVIAEDDTTCAVTGDLSWGDYVITTAAAPIKSGEQVRLAEN